MNFDLFDISNQSIPGFKNCIPDKKALLKSHIGIFTDSLEKAYSLLHHFRERVHGVIVTPGDDVNFHFIGRHLWHLTAPENMNANLAHMVCSHLTITSQAEALDTHARSLEVQLERCRQTVAATRKDYDDSIVKLTEKMGQLHEETELHKKTEQELIQNSQYIKNFVDAMPSVLIGVDDQSRVTLWNTQAVRRTAEPSKNAVGQPIDQLLPDFEGLPPLIQEAIKTGLPITQANTTRKEGEKVMSEDIVVYPIKNGERHEVVIRIDDVTERSKLEAELNQSRKMDAIGQLAGGIAHDFNNLLTGITGAAELLLDSKDENPLSQKSLAELILTSASRGSNLTRKLLTFSKKGSHKTRTVHIQDLVDETISILQNTIDKKTKMFSSHAKDELFVLGDYSELQSVLINLGINADHAIKDAGSITFKTQKITLTSAACEASSPSLVPGQYTQITVTDTGSGIPPEHIDQIFEPFFTTRKLGEGTGLGLAAVYGIIQDHHGHVEVQSEVGCGTTFTLLLPLLSASTQPIPDTPALTVTGQGLILFVDDEKPILKVGQRIMSKLGYDVLTANDGEEAMEIFSDNPDRIDLVLMDLIMPRKNGYDTFVEIKKIRPDCPVILASGFARNGSVESLYEKGLSAFIEKPYRTDELSRLIKQYIRPPSQGPQNP